MQELTKLNLDNEMDLILVHKRSMKLGELAGMSLASQTTFATAVSEVARLALAERGRGSLALGVNADEQGWHIMACLQDRRRYQTEAADTALNNARRLVDELTISVTDQGTDIRLSCPVSDLQTVSMARVESWKRLFNREPPASPYDDIKRKNSQLQELAERLQISDQQYRQMTNSLPLLIFSLTPEGRLIYANQGLTIFSGKTLPELNAVGWLSLFHEDDQTAVRMAWADSVATGLPFRGEWRVRHAATGEGMWHMVSASPQRDAAQQLLHWNGFMADIHAQKVIEQTLRDNEELRQSQSQLENSRQRLEGDISELSRSNTELAQFAYVASHDLQEPLRKIQAFSTMLTEQYAPVLDPTAQDIIRRMQGATGRMQELIRGLLAYSRLNTETPSFRPVGLNQLVTEVLSDLETAIQDRQADIQVGPLPTIQGNNLQLRQMFQNLLSNALKFTPSERVPLVHISALVLNDPQVQGLSYSSLLGNYVEISIRDNGIGFDQKHTDRIFNLFQRLHGRNEYAGTGIGLAVCKKVVDNHGGYLTARSQPGQGATFIIYLPL
ncbi:PAS domain S-box protein [Spirosoma taeanense]|uniref:histidine kinase n=1 Tax=Spirosoma taeanense TaxID=2735870 RepID=A0A6M5YEL3_9BACT|nr:ATP-binding protein [Spirosoma taeanense]QJW91422.1 PAS domain S-box protein [Spirosoma taeanense]